MNPLMDFPSIVLLLLLLVLTLVLLMKHKKSQQGAACNLPPGPKKLPIIGHLHYISELPHRSLWSLSRKFGPLMYLEIGYVPTMVVSSAAMAREVLKNHDLDCCSRPSLLAINKYTYGGLDVAFAPYGDNWKAMRKISIVELFSSKRVQSFRSIREAEVAFMLQAIRESSSIPVNLSKMAMSLTNNVICMVAFGKKCEAGSYEKYMFHKRMEEAQAIAASFFFTDYFPPLGWLDRVTGNLGRLNKSVEEFDKFYERIIEEHLDLDRRVLPEQEDLVDVLLGLHRETNISRAHVKAVLTNIFFGGTDTSALVLTWAMAELIRKPNFLRRAQDEVRDCVGTKGRVEEPDLHQLNYLECVIKETMRLHAPVPLLIPRETIKYFNISGYDVQPKTRVLVNAWAIGRDPDSWDNPNEFLPDRFIDSSVDVKGHDFELIPFGAGRRVCPGINFGIITTELALANLLYHFNWNLPDGTSEEDMDMSEAPGISLQKKEDLSLVATKYVI